MNTVNKSGKTQVDGLLAGTFSDVDLDMGESLRMPTFRYFLPQILGKRVVNAMLKRKQSYF